MVFSEFIYRIPYTIVWHLRKLAGIEMPVLFYVGEYIDYLCYFSIQRHLPSISVVSDNSILRKRLKAEGVSCKALPCYPSAVIMCRHATHKFPCKAIIKIGMRHGAYHFKRMTKARNYNQFDLYLFSSKDDLEAAQKIGVNVGINAGFPRLDIAFDKDVIKKAELLKQQAHKPCILFTATWDKSGMSGIHKWYDKLHILSSKYQIFVTYHPWTDARYIRHLQAYKDIELIEEDNLYPNILASDVVIGDRSSLLAECSALQKPIIVFKTPLAKRSLEEIEELIKMFSIQIESFDQLPETIERVLSNAATLFPERERANRIMFDTIDARAGKQAAKLIKEFIPSLKHEKE